MAITVTNTNALSLLNILNRTSIEQSNALTRLSTGSLINSGKDDPAGLISSRALESELTAVDASIRNNQRTDAMLGVADKALGEVASLLTEIQSLAQQSANEDALSPQELAANQSQIDAAIEAIDRIIGTTEFNGKRLLDGSLGINSSGVDSTKITDLQIYSRDPNAATSLTVELSSAASQAGLTLATTSAASDTELSIQGKDGSVVIEVAAGENLSSVLAKIDAATAQTGVDAVLSGTTLMLRSSEYGSSSFVRVGVVGDTTNFSSGNDYGVDASVLVNGQAAAVDGLNVNYSANGINISFNLTTGYNDGTVSGNETFSVDNSGGATFQLGTTSQTRSTVGINGLYSNQLGSSGLGYLASLKGGGTNSVVNDPTQASLIAKEALSQLSKVQGRLGGFVKYQVNTALNQQTSIKEGLTAAVSTIKDVDYATETANLNKQNVLLQSAISLLGVANQQSSQILSLLR